MRTEQNTSLHNIHGNIMFQTFVSVSFLSLIKNPTIVYIMYILVNCHVTLVGEKAHLLAAANAPSRNLFPYSLKNPHFIVPPLISTWTAPLRGPHSVLPCKSFLLFLHGSRFMEPKCVKYDSSFIPRFPYHNRARPNTSLFTLMLVFDFQIERSVGLSNLQL